jgi:alpha-galactosidase
MILSGDDLTTIRPARRAMLKKLQPPTGVAARFEDDTLQIGTVRTKDGINYVLLNWDMQPREMTVTLESAMFVRELWTETDLGLRRGTLSVTVPGHAGRVLVGTLG